MTTPPTTNRVPLTRGIVEDAPPDADPPSAFPTRAGLIAEMATAREPFRGAWRLPQLAKVPRGDGRLTITIPGWMAPERSMSPIRTFLGRSGHDARLWGFGVIGIDVERSLEQFMVRLDELVEDRPAFLVGWSLGGVMAREAARRRPELVERVVTFGTPALGGPTYTVGASRIGEDECRRIEAMQQQLDAADPITRPITAIYTRNDRVVDWRACIDRYSLDVRHVRVTSTHVGLGIDPDVWQITAETLA